MYVNTQRQQNSPSPYDPLTKITSNSFKNWQTARYICIDYKTNAQITKESEITPILDKLLEYNGNWIQHVNRIPHNRLPRVMKHYSPIGRWNHGRPLKRLPDTWDRDGSTSGPTPWQIHDLLLSPVLRQLSPSSGTQTPFLQNDDSYRMMMMIKNWQPARPHSVTTIRSVRRPHKWTRGPPAIHGPRVWDSWSRPYSAHRKV
jgi:hypothetical protein